VELLVDADSVHVPSTLRLSASAAVPVPDALKESASGEAQPAATAVTTSALFFHYFILAILLLLLLLLLL
jgi:hypothetical protein